MPDKVKAGRTFQIMQIHYIIPLPISETKQYVQAPLQTHGQEYNYPNHAGKMIKKIHNQGIENQDCPLQCFNHYRM